jgi:hypothetical protein
MIKLLQYYLFKKGYINLYKVEDKVSFLLSMDIDLYDINLNGRNMQFREKNIMLYINLLNNINNFNMEINVLDINNYIQKIHNITYNKWCTNNNLLLNNRIDVFKEFLHIFLKVYIKYKIYVNIKTNHTITRNVNILKIYVNNIINIIEDIINVMKEK